MPALEIGRRHTELMIREFGLGDEAAAAATQGDMEAFVKALQNNKEGDKKDDKNKEEDMALD